ncbi:hypothetical protein [Bacillus paranthracis]|uniref:Uncharacterized protein n=1 Tax=Bacillus paranthracis TaxID=2026186 RepID=A0AAJ1K6M3_9BACI|nr:hypothetical protein [Bacillus paranthracis]MDG0949888.1 hypothetical protein [Bacillus paranthracis]MDG0955689.1 hypothetical protein [Bacillus paranthracis]
MFSLIQKWEEREAEGNMTKGKDEQTIDGMSLKRIRELIENLKSEQYQPKPSRRVYI